ncbi:hypothetical protein NUM31_004974 [Salmonella enterica]|nr:hypothetical protein [Salmonella enterica]
MLEQETKITPEQNIYREVVPYTYDNTVGAKLVLDSLPGDELASEKVRKATTLVTVGPKFTARVDTSFVPLVSMCLDPGDGGQHDDDTARAAFVGVSTWRLCVYDKNIKQEYFFLGHVPKKYEATFDATLTSNDFADGNVIGQKLKFKTGLSWSKVASHGAKSLLTATQFVRDLYQANDLNNPARAPVYAGPVWTDTDPTPAPALEVVGFFTGYSQWASSDRDRHNMGRSATEICESLGATVEPRYAPYLPTAAAMQNALNSNPEAAAMTRVNTYGGGHDLIIYNDVPGDRGNGYYPFPSPGPLGHYGVYGIWNKSTVTKEDIASTLTQDVQGAYCTAP